MRVNERPRRQGLPRGRTFPPGALEEAPHIEGRTSRDWLLVALAIEKTVQHAFVTWAFIVDAGDIRDSVVVDYRWLASAGGALSVLFAVAGWAAWQRRRWSVPLLLALAFVDIAGEFIAQGTLAIELTVSFIVAWVIVGVAAYSLAAASRRNGSIRG